MENKKTIVFGVITIVVVLAGLFLISFSKSETLKIGVITPLTGDAAFWGQSSLAGVELIEKDLLKEGIYLKVIVEDGRLSSQLSLSAAQKLVNVDFVKAIYSEFAPAAISVSSFLKDKEIIEIYDAAINSPLAESNNFYKSYTDYQQNCKNVALYLKEQGISRVGLLKVNLEFAELCLQGVTEVFPDVGVESFNPGERDFRTMLSKLKKNQVEAIFNPSLIAEAQLALTQMTQLNMNQKYITASDVLSPDFVQSNKELLRNVITFGLPDVSEDFKERLNTEFSGKVIAVPEAAALAYLHIGQLARALNKCDTLECQKDKLDNAKENPIIQFKGFSNRTAVFLTPIKAWNGSEFVLAE